MENKTSNDDGAIMQEEKFDDSVARLRKAFKDVGAEIMSLKERKQGSETEQKGETKMIGDRSKKGLYEYGLDSGGRERCKFTPASDVLDPEVTYCNGRGELIEAGKTLVKRKPPCLFRNCCKMRGTDNEEEPKPRVWY